MKDKMNEIKLFGKLDEEAGVHVWLLRGYVYFLGTGRQAENRVLGFNPLDTFDKWFADYKKLARKHGIPWIVADKESYREYYEEELTPDDVLTDEVSHATD